MTDLRLFTSESVTEGHPDKICDQISDSILDALLTQDPTSRAAVETLVTTGLVHVAGEVTTSGYVDIPQIVRDRIRDIGYDSSEVGFDGSNCGVTVSIGAQSPDIAQGVDRSYESRSGSASTDAHDLQGAGDQGLMFGYASRDTPVFMPLPIYLAHRLAERLAAVRHSGELAYLRPDGKTQVTIGYEGLVPRTVDTVVLSTQHGPQGSQEDLRREVEEHVIRPVLAAAAEIGIELDSRDATLLINPTGKFEIGGPKGDAGLTGRKIIVDTYGGFSRHGGGAFSGKDPRRSTAAPRTPCAGSPRTRSPRASPTASRCRSPTPSARPRPWASTSRPSARRTCPRSASCAPSARPSTCVPPPSSSGSTCSVPSTRRPPPTATSVASCRTSPGRRSTVSPTCRAPRASDARRRPGPGMTGRVG